MLFSRNFEVSTKNCSSRHDDEDFLGIYLCLNPTAFAFFRVSTPFCRWIRDLPAER